MALVSFWVSVSVAISVPAWAVGLGEIDVESALNETFSATIELGEVNDLQPNEIIVNLASREDFDRIGVERFFFLTDLKFNVEVRGGVGQVVITSSRPISEPYLDFIVEVLWPSGRLLKEFTVLLDPPTFSEAAAAPVAPPAQAPSNDQSAGRVQRGEIALTPAPSTSSSAPTRSASSDGVLTTTDDTLWKIAQRTLPSDRVTVNQQMLAIQRLNRQAFIRDNINLLKAGFVLRIPTESEALSVSNSDAGNEVASQTDAWRNRDVAQRPVFDDPQSAQLADSQGQPLSGSQLDATEDGAATRSATVDNQGEVRILANTGSSAAGSGTGTDAELNELIEERDSVQRELDEAQYKLDRERELSSSQISVRDRQIEVKDQEIAELQEQLKALREQEQSLPNQPGQNQNQRSQPAEAAPWWMSPTVLFGVIGVLVLILVFLLVAMRRNRGAEEAAYVAAAADPLFDEESTSAADIEPSIGIAEEPVETLADELDVAEEEVEDDTISMDEVDALDGDDPEDDVDAEAAELTAAADSGQSQTNDVIGEADIYIAYGRYGQAANLLLGVLGDEPERHDVRVKLLEVFAETNDGDGFSEHAEYLLANCEDQDVLHACRDLEARLENDALDLSSEPMSLEGSAQESAGDTADVAADSLAEPESSAQEPTVDDFSLDLDELENDASEELLTGDEAGGSIADDDFELEFDEGDDLADLEAKTDAVAGETEDVLGGDLGIDFDPERDVADELRDEAETEDTTDLAVDNNADETTDAAEADEGLEDIEFNLDDVDLDNLKSDESVDELLAADDDVPSLDMDDVSTDEVDTAAVEEVADSVEEAVEETAEEAVEEAVEEAPTAASVTPLHSVDTSEPKADSEVDDFDFDDSGEGDINATKLDLAEAYIDMGDGDGAKDILREVLDEGNAEQQEKARTLLAGIG